MPKEPKLIVYTPIPSGESTPTLWIRIGAGFVDHDGSIGVRLDFTPLTNELRILEPREEEEDLPWGILRIESE